MSLACQIEKVKQNIAKACVRSGRNPEEITIIAASKTVSYEILNELKPLRIENCGENRVQEFLDKYGKVDTQWHFIGRLQTNKVKYIIDKIVLLHSLDREALAEEIERQCIKKDIMLKCLIEINIGGEESKGGIEPSRALDFFHTVKEKYPHIIISGIMSVMPQDCEEKYYLQMKDIYDKIKAIDNNAIRYLSVGMSDDYVTAIENGANTVRLGRILFGERHYQ